MKPSIQSAINVAGLSGEELADSVLKTCRELIRVLDTGKADPDRLRVRFEEAVSDIVGVSFRNLDPRVGSFQVADGQLDLNEKAISELLLFVVGDIRQQVSAGGKFDADEIRETLIDVSSLFALHELRHRTQGVEDYGTVKTLKSVGNQFAMARIDILADRDAALALAAVRTCSMQGTEFLTYYQRALYYSVQYFFKIFPANMDRLDKVCRIASLLLMLARLQFYLTVGQLRTSKSTAALHVEISENRRTIAVYEISPQDRLLVANNDVDQLPFMVNQIERGDLDAALVSAFRVANSLNLY